MLGIIDLIGWVIAIAAAVFGIFCWIAMFTDKNGWHIFMGIIAAGVAIIVFTRVYDWLESIGFAIFSAGATLCAFGGACSDTPTYEAGRSKSAERENTFAGAVIDTMCEYELIKAAVKDARRESKK